MSEEWINGYEVGYIEALGRAEYMVAAALSAIRALQEKP